MKKLFVVSDIHSYYDELMKALDKAGFNKDDPDHIFICCGDLLDRGLKARECLTFVNNLKNKILIKGNHEDLLIDIFYKQGFDGYDYSNGTADTVYQISGIKPEDATSRHSILSAIIQTKEDEDIKKYINNCIDYCEIGEYIFVHGWIPIAYEQPKSWQFLGKPTYVPGWRESFLWEDARWLNGMHQWASGIVEPDKTIVCGHWHSAWGHQKFHHSEEIDYSPFIEEGIIAIDGCTAASGIVNCVVLEVSDDDYNKFRCKRQAGV